MVSRTCPNVWRISRRTPERLGEISDHEGSEPKLGYNKAIKRPNLNKVAGPWTIDAADTTITIPNPDLKPERSQKFSAMLEYYFEPAGVASVHVFVTQLKNAADQNDGLTPADVGLGNDPIYSSYL